MPLIPPTPAVFHLLPTLLNPSTLAPTLGVPLPVCLAESGTLLPVLPPPVVAHGKWPQALPLSNANSHFIVAEGLTAAVNGIMCWSQLDH